MQPSGLDQVLSVAGALLVLGAYVGNLVHKLDRDGIAYAALNLAGSCALAWSAFGTAALGLVIIEVAWALVSAGALAQALRQH
jgi:hypothetical protein